MIMKYDERACKFNMDTGCVELLLRDGRINSTQAAVVVAVQVLFRTEKEKPEHKCVLVFPGASSDTAFFENHRSTICF